MRGFERVFPHKRRLLCGLRMSLRSFQCAHFTHCSRSHWELTALQQHLQWNSSDFPVTSVKKKKKRQLNIESPVSLREFQEEITVYHSPWWKTEATVWILTVRHPIRLCSKGRWKARGSPHQSSNSVAAVWKLAGFCKCWKRKCGETLVSSWM